MARVALEIPKVGLVMENARLVRWLKSVGDVVAQGEPLLELETEKSVVEIEAAESGRLVEILMQADQEAHVGDQVGWLENDAVAQETPAAEVNNPAPRNAPALPRDAPAALTDAPPASSQRLKSSPVARRVASQHDIDLRTISGTGPGGRIQLADVRLAIEARSVGTTPRAERLSSMRRAIARSMTLSNATVPQFTVERSVDWTRLHSYRSTLNKHLPEGLPRPSVNDFLLQAISRSLLSFPALNATFSGDALSADAQIVSATGTHIGLVVSIENGLLVPVLHGVQQFGLAQLARQRKELVDRALQGKLKREELEGATFSVSNLGARGPDRFNAIINPPQSAILAVGRQRDCVVPLGGTVQVRPLSQLVLTVDHRVADGRLAADFLAHLIDLLEGDSWRE